MDSGVVPVIQADRDAAADYASGIVRDQLGSLAVEAIRVGRSDDATTVQAFAKHRVTSAAADADGEGTPAAKWRETGSPDPHGTRYDCERASLMCGSLTDDEMANAVFMEPNIEFLTAAKDRIRWLSRSLVEALTAAPAPSADVERVGRLIAIVSEYIGVTSGEAHWFRERNAARDALVELGRIILAPRDQAGEAVREGIAAHFDRASEAIFVLRDASPFHSVSHDSLTTYGMNLSGWAREIRDLDLAALQPAAPAERGEG